MFSRIGFKWHFNEALCRGIDINLGRLHLWRDTRGFMVGLLCLLFLIDSLSRHIKLARANVVAFAGPVGAQERLDGDSPLDGRRGGPVWDAPARRTQLLRQGRHVQHPYHAADFGRHLQDAGTHHHPQGSKTYRKNRIAHFFRPLTHTLFLSSSNIDVI